MTKGVKAELMDLSTMKFGRLQPVRLSHVREVPSGARKRYWICRCDCGNEKIVWAGSLRSGETNSCGCLRREKVAQKNRKHGLAHLPEYEIWCCMKRRCTNPKASDYLRYGGRGITVCERWAASFEAFYADLGPRPSSVHSIDRIDPNGSYEPHNVRWATASEQANNVRRNRKVEVDGDTRTVAEWAKLYGINPYTIYDRLDAGWEPRRAVTTAVRPRA